MLLCSSAQAADECSLYGEVDKYQLLRRLSLDLRHQVPSYEEYRALDDEETVPEQLVDEYLASDEFKTVARRYHDKLLWPRLVGGVQILSTQFLLRSGPGDVNFLNSTMRSRTYRGGTALHACQNKPQVEIQPDYQLGDPPTCETVSEDGVDYCLEGYVNVHPYWIEDPNVTVRLCAFEAQTRESYDSPQGTMSCNTNERIDQIAECGCGPNINYCWGERSAEEFLAEMEEQVLLTVADHTTGGLGYSEMLTTPSIHMNGRLAFYQKYLAQMTQINNTYNAWQPGDAPQQEAPSFFDMDWYVAERSGPHSGILTMPAYTLRFQTNRGRANRARVAFENRYFEPPTGEDTEGCSDDTDDLTQRCTCRYCHGTLEPLAAYWAPLAEAGSALVDGLATYREDCIAPPGFEPGPGTGFDASCGRFYVTDGANERAGWLLTHEFADEAHPEVEANVVAGPAKFAETIILDGSFSRGAVEHVFEHFVGREMNLSSGDVDNEIELLEELAIDLETHDDFVRLVKNVVSRPEYRRVR